MVWCGIATFLQAGPIARRYPNPFGIFDMGGGVYELCHDTWHDSYDTDGDGVSDAPTDGSSWEPELNNVRVVRGGAWTSRASNCRSAARGSG